MKTYIVPLTVYPLCQYREGLPATAFSSSRDKLMCTVDSIHEKTLQKAIFEDELDREIILKCILRRVVQRT